MTADTIEDTRSKYYVHPWRRFVAKTIDLTFFIYVFSFLSGVTYFSAYPDQLPATFMGNVTFGAAMTVLAIGLEAALIAVFGTTPGKLLMKTRIASATGGRISLLSSFSRSVACYVIGLGAGLPLVTLVAMAFSYSQLESEGVTIWDRMLKTYVVHDDMHWWRWVVGASLAGAILLSDVILTFLSLDGLG